MDEIIVRSLQQLSQPTTPSPLSLEYFVDHFVFQELAVNKYIWVRMRKYKNGQLPSEWSAKFLESFQPQGQPLHFVAVTANSKQEIEQLIAFRDPRARLLFDAVAQVFLKIVTSRLVVHSEDSTSCWIDCSHREGGGAYFVSCGVRYPTGRKDAALALWENHFLPLCGVCGASSKALVFSNIYTEERAHDTSVFINHMKAFRRFDPLAEDVLIKARVALNPQQAGVQGPASLWAKLWCDILLSAPTTRPISPQSRVIMGKFTELASKLGNLSVIETLQRSALDICQDVGIGEGAYLALALGDPTRLALAGLCGLLRVWRSPFAFLTPIDGIAELDEPSTESFLRATTSRELQEICARVRALKSKAAKSVPPKSTATLDMICSFVDNHLETLATLNSDFEDFQLSVFGHVACLFCL